MDTIKFKPAQDAAIQKLKSALQDGTHRAVLLMTSYCSDNPACTDITPCNDCLVMSNIAVINKNDVKLENVICGYDFISNCT